MVMITMDAHSRDTIKDLVAQEVSDKSQFQWSRQLRQSFDAGEYIFSLYFSIIYILVNIILHVLTLY